MTREEIRETVLKVLASITPDAQVSVVDPLQTFHDQFDLDSIDFLRLMMALERELNLTIYDFDYPKLSTLAGCETYLEERLMA